MHKQLRKWLIGLGIVAMFLFVFDRFGGYWGIGYVDYSVEFRVMDANSHSPIPGAKIDCVNVFISEEGENKVVVTNQNGVATTTVTGAAGMDQSGFGFRSVKVGPVYGEAVVNASGYVPSEKIDLSRLMPTRTETGRMELVVPISLRKSQP